MRLRFAAFSLLVGCALAACLTSCSEGNAPQDNSGEQEVIRIGTMPTEDFLPMWVAKSEGIFEDEGLNVTLETFDSAPALSAAIAAGEIDMAMVDVMRAAKLCESGTSVIMEWVTLGADASQGQFGVLAPADASYSDLEGLAEWLQSNPDAQGVGVAANTVPEYVFDRLCEEAGIDPEEVRTVEIASLPERYALVANGNLAAAALPNSLLALGQASGLKLLASDTDGENLSQSVMVARESFAASNPDAIMKVADAWNLAVEQIDADPEAYRGILVENANLNEAIIDSYAISVYPYASEADVYAHPSSSYVGSVLTWMNDKGYSKKQMTYDETTGLIIVE